MKKASLVLEGGANRGIFTAGVLDYLMEKELYMSHVVGVSAGSCNAVDYVSKQIGRTKQCMAHKEDKYSYVNLRTMVKKKSLLDMDMIFNRYPNEIYPFDYETYFDSDIKCEIVTTNCETGLAEYLIEETGNKERLMKLSRASSSMPLVSPIVKIDKTPYLDGGLADSIPLEHALQIGNEKVILILTRNATYRKKRPTKLEVQLYRTAYGKYPKLVRTILRRFFEYNKTMSLIKEMEDDGKIFVIRPQMKAISKLESDHDTLVRFYNHGYNLMKKQYQSLMTYLEN